MGPGQAPYRSARGNGGGGGGGANGQTGGLPGNQVFASGSGTAGLVIVEEFY